MKKDYIQIKIREFRKKANLSQIELGIKAFNYQETKQGRQASQSRIKKLESGEQKAKAWELEKIAEILNRNIVDFFINKDPSQDRIPKYYHSPIPVISWISAGEFTEPIENGPPGVSGEGDPVYSRKKVGKKAFALKVEGDSMQPRYLEGDIIIVDPEIQCENGAPCVVWLNGDASFKRIKVDDHEIRLIPDNPKYPEIIVSKNRQVDFRMIGKVVDMVPKL